MHMHAYVYVSFLLSFSPARSILSLVLLEAELHYYQSKGFSITFPKGMKGLKNMSGERDYVNFSNGFHNQIWKRREEVLGTRWGLT